MSDTARARVSAGVPTGGQFATQDRSEASVALAPELPPVPYRVTIGDFRFELQRDPDAGTVPEDADYPATLVLDSFLRADAAPRSVDFWPDDDAEWGTPHDADTVTAIPADADPDEVSAMLASIGFYAGARKMLGHNAVTIARDVSEMLSSATILQVYEQLAASPYSAIRPGVAERMAAAGH